MCVWVGVGGTAAAAAAAGGGVNTVMATADDHNEKCSGLLGFQ